MNYEGQDEDDDEEVEVLKIHLKVIQGDQLVAKDRNLRGQWTTSDPYVTVSFFPRGLNNEVHNNSNNNHPEIKLGQSETIRYTLSPQWLFEADIEVPRQSATDDCQFVVVIRDWDDDLMAGEEPPENLMGVVPVNVTPNMYRNLPFTTRTKWYGVPAESAERASGRIQCQIDVQKQRKRRSEINSAPAFKKPMGKPILDQATYTPSKAEEEFSNALRKEERQGDGSVLTDLKLLRLSVQGSVTGATEMATGAVSKSTLGRMTLGAADAVKQTALGGMNGVSQVASFGVNGVRQVAVGSTNLATQAVTGSVNGVTQVATGSVNMASQVATGGVNMASQVATGGVNMAAQTMKTTAGIVTAPLGMFSSKHKNTQSATTTRSNSMMPKSLSTRNMFSSMPFSVSGNGESSAPPMRKALSSKNLFSSMPFTTSGSGTPEESLSKNRRSRQSSLGGTRKTQSSRNMLKGKEKYASLLKSSGQQDDNKLTSQASDPLSIPAQRLSKPISVPQQQHQSNEPNQSPTLSTQPPSPKPNAAEKEQYKLDIAKAKQLEEAKSKQGGGGQRPRPVRQRSAPRIRKSNSTRKLQLSGGELSLEDKATLLDDDLDTQKISSEILPTKTQQQDSERNQEENDRLAIESIKKKKLERKSMALAIPSFQSLNNNVQSKLSDHPNTDMSEKEKKKMRKVEKRNSTVSKSSDPSISTSMSDKERKKLKKEKKKMRKSKTLAASYDHQETLLGPAPGNLSGPGPGNRRSMEHANSERRNSTASTVSEVTAASSSINVEEFEAMKKSLLEKDERLLKMERELAELRQALINGASVRQSSLAKQSAPLELEINRRASMDHATTKKNSGSVGYEQDRRASAGHFAIGGEAARVPIMIGKQEDKNLSTISTVPTVTSTAATSQENEAGFYVDAEGVEYYLDPKGIEYYKDADGEWYADFLPDSSAGAEETAGWFMDVDGTKYYLDEFGVEYNQNPKDGEYYSNEGQRLNLQKISRKN